MLFKVHHNSLHNQLGIQGSSQLVTCRWLLRLVGPPILRMLSTRARHQVQDPLEERRREDHRGRRSLRRVRDLRPRGLP